MQPTLRRFNRQKCLLCSDISTNPGLVILNWNELTKDLKSLEHL